MTTPALYDEMLELLRRFGIEVRSERLGGGGGGLCRVKGKRVLFVDLDADQQTQSERCIEALRMQPEIESMYLTPALRALVMATG